MERMLAVFVFEPIEQAIILQTAGEVGEVCFIPLNRIMDRRWRIDHTAGYSCLDPTL